jgi:hypothetical protein
MIDDPNVRRLIPKNALVTIEKGEQFDFSTLNVNELIPTSRQFIVY